MINRLTMTRAASLCALAITAAVATGSAMPHTAAAAAGNSRFTFVGNWQPTLLPPGGDQTSTTNTVRMAFDIDRRVMWTVADQFPTILAAYDARSGAPLAPGVLVPGVVNATAVDPATGRLYVAWSHVGQVPPVADAVQHLDVYALDGGRVDDLGQADLTQLGAGTDIVSLYLDDPRGALYATWEVNSGEQAGVGLMKLALAATAPALQWTYMLPPSCPASPNGLRVASARMQAPALGFSEAKHAVYLLCAVPSLLARPPLLGGVGKVSLGAGDGAPAPVGGFTLFPVAGDVNMSNGSAFDAVSGRIIFDSQVGSGSSEPVFDIAADRYVGLLDGGINQFIGISVDTVNGRFYGELNGNSHGLTVADFRTTPPSQPRYFPDINFQNRMVEDPGGTNVWLYDQLATPATWHIYHDTMPALDLGSGAADPDSNTTDIAEDPQTTGATYNASAQAFGVVEREVGGAESAAQDTENVFQVNGNSNPEMRAAYVNGISLSTDEATASSIAADRDAPTTGAEQASVCASSPAPLQPTTCPWPYNTAACASFGTLTSGSDSNATGAATASCSMLQRSATTSASLTAVNLGEVTAASTSSTATILEDATAGVSSRVTAEAHNVVALGGALHIAQIITTAEAHAHGRRGTAGTTFSRDVEGVTFNGTALCTSRCNLDVVANEIDAAYSGRILIDFPSPDAGLAKGSPGGYQAVIRLSDGAHLDDVFNDAQPADRVEVPGMVITIPIDGSRPSRTVISLAGVETEARYGIYPLDQFLADQAAGEAPSGPPASVIAGATGALLPDLPASVTPLAAPSTAATAATSAAPAGIAAILGWHGWQWAFAHPGEFLRLLAVWLVFLVPVYLSARRWSLLRRHAIQMDLSA